MGVGDDLQGALESVEKEEYEPGLDLLIRAWGKTRLPEIAAAVDAVDALMDEAPFVEEKKKPEPENQDNQENPDGSAPERRTWAVAARDAHEPSARGPLIRAIAGMTTAEILASMSVVADWNDPRVGTLIIGLLTELRYSGARSQPFWVEIFDKIPAQMDPRFIDLAETLPKTWTVGPSMQRWLTNHLTRVAKDIRRNAVLSPENAAKVERVLEVTRARAEARARAAATATEHGGAISGDALLAEIYANPNDDAPRLVYADWLLERGDPRGELITLQFRPDSEKDRATRQRERQLLKANRKAWIGQIAAVVGGDLEFRRGFLAKATVKFRHQRDVEQYGSRPEWATLEELEWGDQLVRNDQKEWSRYIGPAMRHVKIARQPMAKFLVADDRGPPWALEELEMWYSDDDAKTFRELLASPRLSKLRSLTIRGWRTSATWLDGVTRCPSELSIFMNIDDEECAKWRSAAKRCVGLETLLFRDGYETEYRFTRDAESGGFTRLDVQVRPRTKIKSLKKVTQRDFKSAITVIGKLPAGSLTHFHATIEVGGVMVLATQAMDVGNAKLV